MSKPRNFDITHGSFIVAIRNEPERPAPSGVHITFYEFDFAGCMTCMRAAFTELMKDDPVIRQMVEGALNDLIINEAAKGFGL
jgi:hypothetical protein